VEEIIRPDRAASAGRGYGRLYAQEILGADEGCDFRFLKPGFERRRSLRVRRK
jgi:hypothetical protein